MTDENDKTNDGAPQAPTGTPSTTGPRAPLSLKPRQAGSVSTGTVRQSFSHGRTKTVVVETKRRAGAVQGVDEVVLAAHVIQVDGVPGAGHLTDDARTQCP